MDSAKKSSKDEKPEEDMKAKQRRIEEIAVYHARDIETKKNLQNRVLDLILEAYDLPSEKNADPTNPAARDLAKFRECLSIFRPSDLDELVDERNIDHRCGYTLCNNDLQEKTVTGKVWSNKLGTLIEKKDLNQYCSRECSLRNTFVRNQLSVEPAWTRAEAAQEVFILDVAPLSDNIKPDPAQVDDKARQMTLRDERIGHTRTRDNAIEIVEKESSMPTKPPTVAAIDVLEGLPVRNRKQ